MTPWTPEKYPDTWAQLAEQCKAAAGWKCEWCDQRHDPDLPGAILTVHHPDRDPDNADARLLALCQRCHLRDEADARRREAARNMGQIGMEIA